MAALAVPGSAGVVGSIGDEERDFAECLGASDDAPGCLPQLAVP